MTPTSTWPSSRRCWAAERPPSQLVTPSEGTSEAGRLIGSTRTTGIPADSSLTSCVCEGSTSTITAPRYGLLNNRVTQSPSFLASVITTSMFASLAATSTPVSTPFAQLPFTWFTTRSISGKEPGPRPLLSAKPTGAWHSHCPRGFHHPLAGRSRDIGSAAQDLRHRWSARARGGRNHGQRWPLSAVLVCHTRNGIADSSLVNSDQRRMPATTPPAQGGRP